MRATVSAAKLLLVGLLLVGLAGPSAAVVVPFREGRLTIRIEALGEQYSLQAPAVGRTLGTVNVNRTATTLESFALPAGSFSVSGVTVPVTDPELQPITGLIGSFENEAGGFSSPGGTLGGTMGLRMPGDPEEPGIVEVCLLFSCEELILVEVPLSVLGEGGQETVETLGFSFTLTGAPWTIGTVSVPVDGGEETESGSLSVLGDGFLRVRLVTPIAIGVDADAPTGIPSQIAAFGLLDLEIAPAPEPDAAAAGIASAATLAALARRRRERSSTPC
jgi:hypothetical protein